LVREKKSRSAYLTIFLVGLMALDIATVATWHVRHFTWNARPYYERAPGTVGLPKDDPGNHTANILLQTRQIKEQLDAGADPSALPPLGTLTIEENNRVTGVSTTTSTVTSATTVPPFFCAA